jgi:ATP-dependent RNA helicase DDX23/PRP28
MPQSVEKLAKEYLRKPVNVTVGQVGQVVDRIEQRVEMVAGETKKLSRIERILNSREFEKPIMIFANQKKTCDTIAWALGKRGVSLICLTLSFDVLFFMVESLRITENRLL